MWFPNMAKILSMKVDSTFGTHIVAGSDINVGQCVIDTPAFASIEYLVRTGLGCFQCGKSSETPIRCQNCIDVFFCSDRCKNSKSHRSKCDPMFESKDCRLVRLTTKIITVAINLVGDTMALFEFCRTILFSNRSHNNCRPPYSTYYEVLTLKGSSEYVGVNAPIARRVVKYVLPQIESLALNIEDKKRILFSLALRHANTISINSFSETTNCSKGGARVRYSIFDVLCRLNHSCKPNLIHYVDDDSMTSCIAARPIKSGEQLFINYLVGSEFGSAEERRAEIKDSWHFTCECELCCDNDG